MPPKLPPSSRKRKAPPSSEAPSKPNPKSTPKPSDPRAQKRVKTMDARHIRASPSSSALNAHQELDVGAFVKAHQHEIKALEDSMGLAKKQLASRAFQSVPRELRRRTASHNVKKVPKRLQNRARREMREDNTPTVTKRGREKSGRRRLRGEIARARREGAGEGAKEGEGGETRTETEEGREEEKKDEERKDRAEGLAEPPVVNPKFKKRQVHQSWLPTHVWHAKRAHMTDPKKPLWRFAVPLTPTEKAYRTTHRASTLRGCVAWDTSYKNCISASGDERGLLSFLGKLGVPEAPLNGKQGEKWRSGSRTWSGWVREQDHDQALIAQVVVIWERSSDASKRKLLVRVHPSAFHQLWKEMCKVAKMQRPMVKVEDLRFEIGSIEIAGPAATEALVGILSPADSNEALKEQWSILTGVNSTNSLPANTLLNFPILDTRLGQPHRTAKLPTSPEDQDKLLNTLAEWPFDKLEMIKSLLDGKDRSDAAQLPSQKSINRRKGEALPGEHPTVQSTDPAIPIILFASKVTSSMSSSGSWTLLLPWKCTQPVWYSLMHYPVSSGNNPRMGGLEQQRQLCFENNTPWFPGDFPGTKAGWEWELMEREKRKQEWEKRPKGKRVEWSSLDLGTGEKGEVGDGWACDWERLLTHPKENKDEDTMEDVISSADTTPPPGLHQYPGAAFPKQFVDVDSKALATISISLLNRGHSSVCARIYRLPSTNVSLRESWQSLADPTPKSALKKIRPVTVALKGKPTPADDSYPVVPGAEDLVGFVTSGNYNLGEGRATGVGNVLLGRLIEDKDKVKSSQGIKGLCIVREAGQKVGRLAHWRVI
ncbi:MAG: hypothetical protein MMC23_004855 [Stictis urceolatum]|nr:hypothetical protein [Stictis urceolata]